MDTAPRAKAKAAADAKARLGGGQKPDGTKGKKAGGGFIVLAVIVILIGAFVAILYYSGKLTPLLEAAGLIKPAEAEAQMSAEELSAWEAELSERETKVGLKEEELKIKETELSEKEKELIVKENNLKIFGQSEQAEREYDQTFQEMIAGLTDEEIAYFKRMSSVYSKMEPAEAASVLVKLYDIQKIAAIIYYMQPSASAPILELMDEETAADITEMILN